MERFAGAYLDVLCRAIAAAHPNLSGDKTLLSATLICATLDGLPGAIAAATSRSGDAVCLLQDTIKFATQIPTFVSDTGERSVFASSKV